MLGFVSLQARKVFRNSALQVLFIDPSHQSPHRELVLLPNDYGGDSQNLPFVAEIVFKFQVPPPRLIFSRVCLLLYCPESPLSSLVQVLVAEVRSC